MRSRIVSIVISVLLFSSSFYVVGLTEKDETAVNATTATTAAVSDGTTTVTTEPEKKVDPIVCSFKDVSYGSNKMQTLDLKLPIDDRKETGLYLFMHGGGWVSGDKTNSSKIHAIKTSDCDYATASINYRYAEFGKYDIYDIIDDITAALEYIKTFAAGYSVNINKVVLSGSSAGGHLALLYAYRFKELSPIDIVGVIASCPAADLTNEDFLINNELGDEEHMFDIMSSVCGTRITSETRYEYEQLLADISPVNYVSSACVPTMINHGRKDEIAPFEASEELCTKLKENNVQHEFVIFEESGHKLNKDEKTAHRAEELSYKYIREWLNVTE